MSTQTISMETHRPDSHVRKPAHEQIAALAYQLHIGGGGQAGASLEDWLFAEYLLSELQATSARETTTKDETTHRLPGVSAAKPEAKFEPSPLPEPRKMSRPARQEPMAFPLAASVPGRHFIPERVGAHVFQSIHDQQPAMADFEMATVHDECADRWRGINE